MVKVKQHITSFKNSPRWFKTNVTSEQPDLKIDLTTGVIKDVSVCTVGQAKGHGVMLEQEFIETIVQQGNECKLGLKCRFGHPNMSSESLGTYLGRFKNFRVSGNKAIADLYLDTVCKNAPGGNLFDYVLAMAQKNPDMFGTSIVFEPGKTYQKDEDGNKVYPSYDEDDDDEYSQPKLKFESQPLFIECKSLLGTDVVDDPAANEGGLFSSTQFNADKFAVRITNFLDENPAIWQYVEKHPDKFKPFLEKYALYQSKKSPKSMSKYIPARRGFFSKFIAAVKNNETFATQDATTTDGTNIRIVSVDDQIAIGDEMYIVAEDGSESVATDGDYTIAGGDLDGYTYSVVDGKITAIKVPDVVETDTNSTAPVVQQSSAKADEKLKAENDKLKKQLKKLEDENKALKEAPLAEHTSVGGDEDPNGIVPDADKDAKFRESSWNRKYAKYNKQTPKP